MTFYWGRKSRKNREMLHPDLCRVADRALSYGIMDFMIDCSHRGKEEQDIDYYGNPQKSKVPWPKSKHNRKPSDAMDCVPVINGKSSWNKLHCCVLSGLIQAAAVEERVNMRWGGNWDMDSEPITDQEFQDLVHYEKIERID